MYRLRQLSRAGTHLALVVTLLAAVAWGQASSSVEEQFAAYHQQLAGMANNLLTAPAPSVIETLHKNNVPIAVSVGSDSFSSALARVQQLRPLLEPILREEGVPMDVTAVVLIESGGRLTALSPKGALGLWQLMPETARRYGLAVSPGRDERTDLTKATRAAARYLHDLYTRFGDWQLAFAAYNAGEQVVQRALARSHATDFTRASGLLPAETRAYVPAVLAAAALFGNGRVADRSALHTARTAHVLYAKARLDAEDAVE